MGVIRRFKLRYEIGVVSLKGKIWAQRTCREKFFSSSKAVDACRQLADEVRAQDEKLLLMRVCRYNKSTKKWKIIFFSSFVNEQGEKR